MKFSRNAFLIYVVCLMLYTMRNFCNGEAMKENNHADKMVDKMPTWLVNLPVYFRQRALETRHHIYDVSNDKTAMEIQQKVIDRETSILDTATDAEIVDVIEHFFWGKKGGVSIELGALDGSMATQSMTHGLEGDLGWKRILIEGNPKFREEMKKHSPQALSVNAAICQTESLVHYLSSAGYTSGMVEYMDDSFIKHFAPIIQSAERISGDKTTIDWESQSMKTMIKNGDIIPISCVRLDTILKFAHVDHVNFFILDVEGGEIEVLRSIDWDSVKFDVLCIETDPDFRPNGFIDEVKAYMFSKGYRLYADRSRNSWFIHESFTPSAKAGVDSENWSLNIHEKIPRVMFSFAITNWNIKYYIMFAVGVFGLYLWFLFRRHKKSTYNY